MMLYRFAVSGRSYIQSADIGALHFFTFGKLDKISVLRVQRLYLVDARLNKVAVLSGLKS